MAQPVFDATLEGFEAFCDAVGFQLRPFQRRIAAAHFSQPECVAVLPRGSEKSLLASRLAVHHVLSHERPGVYIGAASREQARIVGGMIRDLSRHPVVAPHVIWRTDALRWAKDPKGTAVLSIVASSGDKAHGWPHPTLIVGDEIWAWADREPSLLGAMMTAMLKVPGCRFLGISTAAASLNSPLGKLRARALSQPHVERTGPVLEAGGDGLAWLEWSLAEDQDPEDMQAVAACNPLRSVEDMRVQRARTSEIEWLQFHCCRWGVSAARWLPPGSWSDCQATYDVADDEPLVLGLDVGGSRSETALVGCVADEDGVRVALVETWQGRSAVLAAEQRVRELAQTRHIAALVFDPMRADHLAQAVERDYGVLAVEWPNSPTRMTLCSEHLLRLVVEGKLRHPGDPQLDAHVQNAVAQPTPRGWRLVKPTESLNIDAVIALAMAAEVASKRPAPVELIAWV